MTIRHVMRLQKCVKEMGMSIITFFYLIFPLAVHENWFIVSEVELITTVICQDPTQLTSMNYTMTRKPVQ